MSGYYESKQNLIDLIGTYTSISRYSKKKTKKNSINIDNDGNIIKYMLDIITVLIGSVALYKVVGELIINVIRGSNTLIRNELINQLTTFNSSDQLPAWFVNTGFTIPISRIDLFKKFKNSPTSSLGQLYYDTTSFNYYVYSAINSPGNEISFNNIITITYNSSSDTLLIKPIIETTIGDFFNQFFSNNIVYEKSVLSFGLNSIFGTIGSEMNKSFDDLINEEKHLAYLTKYLSNKEDTYITNVDVENINKKVFQLYGASSLVDIGCGYSEITMSLSTLTGLTNTIINSDNSEEIGLAIDNSFDNTFSGVDTSEFGGTSSAKDSLFKEFIFHMQVALFKESVLSPQSKLGMLLYYAFKNNGDLNSDDSNDDYSEYDNLMNCISKEINGLFNEFLFNFIKKELLSILIAVQKAIINEKFNNYIGILKSLIQ